MKIRPAGAEMLDTTDGQTGGQIGQNDFVERAEKRAHEDSKKI